MDMASFPSGPNRREAMRKLALAGLSTACAAGVGALWLRAAQQGAFSSETVPGGFTRIDHQLGWTKGVQFGGNFIADHLGLFEQEKLDVHFSAGGPGTDYRTIVSSGRSTVSETNPPGMIDAAIHGQPIVAFAAILQNDPGVIISSADSPISSLRDMVGKTMGLPNTIRGQVTALMQRAGIDPDSVRFVPVGTDPGMLMAGQVDAYFNWATTAVPSLEMAGFRTHTLSMSDIGAPGYGEVLIARRDRLEQEFDLFVRYTRALIGGWGWMAEHPRETARIVVEDYADPGRDVEEQAQQARMLRDYILAGDARDKGLLWINPDVFEANIRLAYDSGTIPRGMKVEPMQLMTQDVVKAAHGLQ
jgi:NitT/TauT family transport system substrate-binding protein